MTPNFRKGLSAIVERLAPTLVSSVLVVAIVWFANSTFFFAKQARGADFTLDALSHVVSWVAGLAVAFSLVSALSTLSASIKRTDHEEKQNQPVPQ